MDGVGLAVERIRVRLEAVMDVEVHVVGRKAVAGNCRFEMSKASILAVVAVLLSLVASPQTQILSHRVLVRLSGQLTCLCSVHQNVVRSPGAGAYVGDAQLRRSERDMGMRQAACDFWHQVAVEVETLRARIPL